MKNLFYILALVIFATFPSYAAPQLGQPAPDFTATDIKGQAFKLSDQKGKIVILEWTNDQCPFVKKQYETGNMQKVQKEATEKDVVWVSVISSAPGRQGHVTKEQAQKIIDDAKALPSAQILDESGDIGRLYDAKTTPHMFVIDKDSKLVYAGAIDDQPSPRHETVENAKNYVLAALDNLEAGEPVETPLTEPYGCAVKYTH